MKSFPNNKLFITLPLYIGVIVAVSATYVWFEKVYFSPTSLFNRMLRTNLSQSGYGKRVVATKDGQTVNQTNMVNTIPKQETIGRTQLVYIESEESQTKVTTEFIASNQQEFVRYTQLDVSENDQDFTDVLGQWAYTPTRPDTKANNTYNESLFSGLPQGYLPPQKRKELIDFALNERLFLVNFSNSKVTYNGIRAQRTYDVSMTAQNYIRYLKRYAELSGTSGLETVTPEDFADSADISMELTVDVLTSRLLQIDVPTVGRKESFVSYGAVTPIVIPQTSLKVDELQSLLQAR